MFKLLSQSSLKQLSLAPLLFHLTLAAVLSSSSLEMCNKRSGQGEDSQPTLDCSEKMVLLLSIDSNQLLGTEQIQFRIDEVKNKTTNLDEDLAMPLYVSIAKTQPYYYYPLAYKQDFPYFLRETSIDSSVVSCKDSLNDASPTCGWQYYSDTNNKIPHSQGFCCDCSLSHLVGLTDAYIRGTECTMLNLQKGSSSAHCLRFSEPWFSGYEILAPYLSYEIKIQISKYGKDSSKVNLVLGLSPIRLMSMSTQLSTKLSSLPKRVQCLLNQSVQDLQQRLLQPVQDLMPSQMPQTLSNKIYMLPTQPESHTMVKNEQSTWQIFVDREQVSFTGQECNKIGTSYAAFNNQPGDGCTQPLGTCLANQIMHLIYSDRDRIRDNQHPSYLVKGFNTGMETVIVDNQRILRYPVREVQTTLLRLEVSADSVRFQRNIADVVIDYARISNDGFEALTDYGSLSVLVSNVDTISGSFQLSLNCSSGIIVDPQSTHGSLPMVQSSLYNFTIRSTVTQAKRNSCLLTIINPIGEQIDNYTFEFNTTAQVSQASGVNQTYQDGEYQKEDSLFQDQCEACDHLFDILCFVIHKCIHLIIKAVVVGVLVPLILLTCVFKCVPCKIVRYLTSLQKKREQQQNDKQMETSQRRDGQFQMHDRTQDVQIDQINRTMEPFFNPPKSDWLVKKQYSEPSEEQNFKVYKNFNLEKLISTNSQYFQIAKDLSFSVDREDKFQTQNQNSLLEVLQEKDICDSGLLRRNLSLTINEPQFEILDETHFSFIEKSLQGQVARLEPDQPIKQEEGEVDQK